MALAVESRNGGTHDWQWRARSTMHFFPMGVAQVSRLIVWAVVLSPTAIAAETSADLTVHNAFKKELVVSLARQLAAKPFEAPPEVSRQLSDIGYEPVQRYSIPFESTSVER